MPESRELDLFAGMLEAEGARTIRCPLVTILDLDDAAPVEAWLRRLIAGDFQDLVLLTGEGLRRMLGVADRAGVRDAAVRAIGQVRTVIRGPKPAKALREIGLPPGVSAPSPTTEGVIEALGGLDLKRHKVGVQLYPGNPNAKLLEAIRAGNGEPDAVTPYRYASDAENGKVESAIRDMAAGAIDFIAFTSSPQVQRFANVARERNLESELKTGLQRTRIAAVGPVVASSVEAIGGKVALMPGHSFHMKPLVNAIAAAIA